jgi:hypothetical protein
MGSRPEARRRLHAWRGGGGVPSGIVLAVVAAMLAAPVLADNRPVWFGVYQCFGPPLADGAARVVPEVEFALLDDAAYSDRVGGRGRYKLGNGVLSMMSGPLSGRRYRQTSPLTFNLIDMSGSGGVTNCSINPSKDVRAGGW